MSESAGGDTSKAPTRVRRALVACARERSASRPSPRSHSNRRDLRGLEEGWVSCGSNERCKRARGAVVSGFLHVPASSAVSKSNADDDVDARTAIFANFSRPRACSLTHCIVMNSCCDACPLSALQLKSVSSTTRADLYEHAHVRLRDSAWSSTSTCRDGGAFAASDERRANSPGSTLCDARSGPTAAERRLWCGVNSGYQG